MDTNIEEIIKYLESLNRDDLIWNLNYDIDRTVDIKVVLQEIGETYTFSTKYTPLNIILDRLKELFEEDILDRLIIKPFLEKYYSLDMDYAELKTILKEILKIGIFKIVADKNNYDEFMKTANDKEQ